MRKSILNILALICLMPLNACAQWYLFPSQKKDTSTRKETVRPEPRPVQQESVQESAAPEIPAAEEEADTGYRFIPAESVDVALILPFKANGQTPNANYLEMYGGALMAVRDLGATGLKIRLSVFDSADSDRAAALSEIENADVIIGPVEYAAMRDAASAAAYGRFFVSPLEPRNLELAGRYSVIQAPASWELQAADMVRRLREDINAGDEIIVIRDTTVAGHGQQTGLLLDELRAAGVRYRTVGSVSAIRFDKYHTFRCLIASDKESFIKSESKALGVKGALGENLILYGTARLRNYIAATDLHSCRAHISAGYFVDYDSDDVRDFILSYRALFKTEPGSFAFQGYDIMKYFVTVCSSYGRRWYHKLGDVSYYRGLQSNFRFEDSVYSGKANTGVRRITYNKDLSTALE